MPENPKGNDVFHIQIQSTDPEALSKVLKEPHIDFGCRPKIVHRKDGTFVLNAFVAENKLTGLRERDYRFEVIGNATQDGRERQKEVGHGDRFQGGRIVPHGLGRKVSAREELK